MTDQSNTARWAGLVSRPGFAEYAQKYRDFFVMRRRDGVIEGPGPPGGPGTRPSCAIGASGSNGPYPPARTHRLVSPRADPHRAAGRSRSRLGNTAFRPS
jgi:hypothetical protein